MIWFLLSCSQSEPIPSWPKEPTALEAHCRSERNSDIQTLCWVQLAAVWAQTKDTIKAERACKEINLGKWRAECWFRIGEELGAQGQFNQAITFCAKASPFDKHCLTHAIWRAPLLKPLPENTSEKDLGIWIQETLDETHQAAKDADQGFKKTLAMDLPAQMAHSAVVGSGQSNMKWASLKSTMGYHFRTATAIEATRLMKKEEINVIDKVMRAWRDQKTITGAKKSDHKGRWTKPIIAPHEDQLRRISLFGGGSRLAGESPEEDMQISILHGAFFNGMPDLIFQAALSNSSDKIRWTAASLLTSDWKDKPENLVHLNKLKQNTDDERVLWYLQKLLGSWSKINAKSH